jgi:hypothetical protein
MPSNDYIWGFILNGPRLVGTFKSANSEDCYGHRKMFCVDIDKNQMDKALRCIKYKVHSTSFGDPIIDELFEDLGYYTFLNHHIPRDKRVPVPNEKNGNLFCYDEIETFKCPAP